VLPLLLALAATLCLVSALEEVGCGYGVFWFKVLRCYRVGGQIEQGICRNYREALFGARHFFPYSHQLAQKRLRLTLGVLAVNSQLKEVQLIRCFAVRVNEDADTSGDRP